MELGLLEQLSLLYAEPGVGRPVPGVGGAQRVGAVEGTLEGLRDGDSALLLDLPVADYVEGGVRRHEGDDVYLTAGEVRAFYLYEVLAAHAAALNVLGDEGSGVGGLLEEPQHLERSPGGDVVDDYAVLYLAYQ